MFLVNVSIYPFCCKEGTTGTLDCNYINIFDTGISGISMRWWIFYERTLSALVDVCKKNQLCTITMETGEREVWENLAEWDNLENALTTENDSWVGGFVRPQASRSRCKSNYLSSPFRFIDISVIANIIFNRKRKNQKLLPILTLKIRNMVTLRFWIVLLPWVLSVVL
jgi:hypothetical protein